MSEKESEKLRRQYLLMQATLLKIQELIEELINKEFTDRHENERTNSE